MKIVRQKVASTMIMLPESIALNKETLSHVASLLVIILTTLWWNNRLKILETRAQYDRWVQRARAERDAKEHTILTEKNTRSTPILTASETRDMILRGELNMRQNVVTLAKRCRKYGRNEDGTNAITEEFYDEAAAIAEDLKANKQLLKDPSPLYGVPISVKEYMAINGSYSTAGLACRLHKRDEHDSLIFKVLRMAGALPLCSGNVTQLMMLPESVNRVWGRSRNPWNLDRTPGGSSGGDAALVAMGCVPLAACSDAAGSIRIPASFNGVVGFKPTSMRLSSKGCMKPRKDDKMGTSAIIPASIGPIARTVEDCVMFMKATLVPEMFTDPTVPPIPFNLYEYKIKDKLKIGWFESDGWFEPCATSKRAVRETIDALTEAGHTCVPFKPPTDGWKSYGLLVAINGAEGDMRSYLEALEGEELIDEYKTLLKASKLHDWLRWLAVRLMDKRRAHLLRQTRTGGTTVWELWQRAAEILELRSVWADALQEAGLDAIIHPAMPIAAIKHGLSGKLTASCSYMFLANMLMVRVYMAVDSAILCAVI